MFHEASRQWWANHPDTTRASADSTRDSSPVVTLRTDSVDSLPPPVHRIPLYLLPGAAGQATRRYPPGNRW